MKSLLFFLCGAVCAFGAEKPNIVLIFADDLGIHDLATYGRAKHPTPNLDRLAAEGMRFTAAYCAQPICSPSRAALMTGKHPARLHLTNFLPGRADAPSQLLLQPRMEGQLPLEEITIAELLRGAGYATGLFGKWHLGNKSHGPEAQGFDTVVMPPANTQPSADEGGKGEYAITRAAEAFIEANQARPFFCYVPHNSPHIRLGAKPELIEKHKSAFHPTYAAMIETLDDCAGRLIRKVESLGLAERTIFIFTSDNGGLHVLESPGTPATHSGKFRAGKGYVYEGGLREPLIVRWPGKVRAGVVSETPVVLTDLVPTLLEFAGVDPAKSAGPLDGVSIAKLLLGGEMPARPFFWHFPHYTNQGGRPASAMRDGDWKLIEHLEDGRRELFNLAADPGERNDLAKNEAARVEEMASKLRQWRARVGAQMPVRNPAAEPAMHAALYEKQDPSLLKPGATAAATEPKWKEWRAAMNAATKGQKPKVTPAAGIISLPAKTATVHGAKLRYEPEPYKNTLGFWVNKDDWAEWTFEVPAAGNYELDILQGCGKGSGGAEVKVEIAGPAATAVTITENAKPVQSPADDIIVKIQKTSAGFELAFKVVETGHFQHFIRRSLATVPLQAGKMTLMVKPLSKPGPAVMDLREVRLIPAP